MRHLVHKLGLTVRLLSRQVAGSFSTVSICLGTCVLLLAAATMCPAQTQSSAERAITYDEFNQQLINPSKWGQERACYSANDSELECVREIQNGKLRLAVRDFGNRDSDAGFQFAGSGLSFENPAAITTITTDMVIRKEQESACAANAEFGAAAHVDARFFNIGTGDPNDDIGGHIAAGRVASDPPGQITVYGQVSQGNSNYFEYTFLGTVPMGTRHPEVGPAESPVRCELDEPRHPRDHHRHYALHFRR